MKNTILHFFKLTLALLLFLQVGKVSAQSFVAWTVPAAASSAPITGTYTGGTVTIANSGTTGANVLFQPQSQNDINFLNGAVINEVFTTDGPLSGTSKKLTFTFSSPVIINEINISDIQSSTTGSPLWDDSFTFENVTFTSAVKTAGSTPGTNITLTGASAVADKTAVGRWSTSNAITSFTINFLTTGGYTHRTLYYSMKVTTACNAGITAPVPIVTTKTNVCPANTVSLPTTSAGPTGTTVKWFTNNAHTGTALADATQAPAGTYYAFYYDSTNDCYSPASAAVTATVAACCPTTSPTVN